MHGSLAFLNTFRRRSIPTIVRTRVILYASAVKLNSARTFSKPHIKNAPWFIHCLMLPKGCSTSSRRCPGFPDLPSAVLLSGSGQIHSEPTGGPPAQEYRLRLKRPPPNASRGCPPFKSSTAFRALAPTASFRGSLCFASLSAKKYGTPYFSARNRTSK